jgi:hypothetical protein
MASDFTPSNPGAMFSAYKLAAVTPSDSTDLGAVRALFVGGAGDISVLAQGDSSPVVFTVPAGIILPIFASKVYATGTDATNIIAMY